MTVHQYSDCITAATVQMHLSHAPTYTHLWTKPQNTWTPPSWQANYSLPEGGNTLLILTASHPATNYPSKRWRSHPNWDIRTLGQHAQESLTLFIKKQNTHLPINKHFPRFPCGTGMSVKAAWFPSRVFIISGWILSTPGALPFQSF